MEMILLDETRFDDYAINNPNYNFYQTSNYGRLMSKHGHNSYYLGLVDDNNIIKAASLVIVKNDKESTKRKMCYAPRGFLIDWNDIELVKAFTEKIKDFLSKRGFTYLKVDPMIIYKSHDYKGKDNPNILPNDSFVSNMQKLGYIHMGFNKGMEANKPRWNAIVKLSNDITSLYNTLSKEARNKIKESAASGCKVYKGSSNDINLLFSVINKQTPPLDYYLDYYQFFSPNNGFELYFTKLEPVSYVNSSKNMYENEEQRNHLLNEQIQDYNIPNKEEIINEKMKSDSLLGKYKKNMQEAINLFQKYPSGLVIAATAVIKTGKTVTFIADGVNENFKKNYPDYLLKWQLLEQYAAMGYTVADYNGITGDFNGEYYNTIKTELSNEVVEYVGEFDLVINKKSYYTGSKLNPILSWLNTPI